MSDIYGAITDSAVNRGIRFLMKWRPSLFNMEESSWAINSWRVLSSKSVRQQPTRRRQSTCRNCTFWAGGTAPNEVVKRFDVKPDGYMVLHVGHGEGGYHVLLSNTTTSQRTPWNSQRLKTGDLFSAIPLRPGSYSLSNVASEQVITTRLVVTYPDPRHNKKGRPRPAPVYANFHRQSFDQGC